RLNVICTATCQWHITAPESAFQNLRCIACLSLVVEYAPTFKSVVCADVHNCSHHQITPIDIFMKSPTIWASKVRPISVGHSVSVLVNLPAKCASLDWCQLPPELRKNLTGVMKKLATGTTSNG